MEFPDAIQIVRLQARQSREESRSYGRNPRWWQFLWPRPVVREKVAGRERFIAGTATGKRILFCWCDSHVVASNATNVFALDEDYHLGILTSCIHTSWAEERSSTLEDRIRYTPTSAFETFPWPYPTDPGIRDAVAAGARAVVARRQEICVERDIGLTRLYNEVDEGAYEDLAELHHNLDTSVASAYSWQPDIARRAAETNRALRDLNADIAAGRRSYVPF